MAQNRNAPLLIGAFSRLSRLSIKALRLYDELGLLRPAFTDEITGYRHYAPSQVSQAEEIGLLRQLDLPLQAIRQLLDAPPDERGSQLTEMWNKIDTHHERRRDLYDYLLKSPRFTSERSPAMTTLLSRTRLAPAQPLVSLTRQIFIHDLEAFYAEARERLARFITQQGGQKSGPLIGIFHGQVNTDSDGPVEIALPYTGTLVPEGEFALRVEPEHYEAYVALERRRFHFPEILTAYDATRAYAQEVGTPGPLSPREIYTGNWEHCGPDDIVGEVAWPFVPEDGR